MSISYKIRIKSDARIIRHTIAFIQHIALARLIFLAVTTIRYIKNFYLFSLCTASRAEGTTRQHSRVIRDLVTFARTQGVSPKSIDETLLTSFLMQVYKDEKAFSYVHLVSFLKKLSDLLFRLLSGKIYIKDRLLAKYWRGNRIIKFFLII